VPFVEQFRTHRETIHGKLKTMQFKDLQHGHQFAGVLEQYSLGEVKFELLALQFPFLQRLRKARRQAGTKQLRRHDIEGERQTIQLAVRPRRPLPEYFRHRSIEYRIDQAGLTNQGLVIEKRHHAALGVVPCRDAKNTGGAFRPAIDLEAIAHFEVIRLESAKEGRRPVVALGRARFQIAGIKAKAVLEFIHGGIERCLGMTQNSSPLAQCVGKSATPIAAERFTTVPPRSNGLGRQANSGAKISFAAMGRRLPTKSARNFPSPNSSSGPNSLLLRRDNLPSASVMTDATDAPPRERRIRSGTIT